MGLKSWYEANIMPRMITCACSQGQVMKRRAMVVPRAAGDVFELGCGGGINHVFYDPSAITSYAGIDPHEGLLEGARAAARSYAEGLGFPEGPIIMPDGSVILVEIRRGTISRVWNGRTEVIATPGGGPNGIALGPDGALYVCNNGGFEWHDVNGMVIPGYAAKDYSGGRIERVDLSTGKVERVYDSVNG